MRLLSAVLLFFCCCIFADNNWISQFGSTIVSKASLIVRAKPLSLVNLSKGNTAIQVQIEEILYGHAVLFQKMFIFSISSSIFSKEESWILFLKPMSSQHCMECIGFFSVFDQDAQEKIIMLHKLLLLEKIENQKEKEKAYLSYCLDGLMSSKLWIQSQAYAECFFLAKQYPYLLDSSVLPKLQQAYNNLLDTQIKEKIGQLILSIRQKEKLLEEDEDKEKITFWDDWKKATSQWSLAKTLEEKAKVLQCVGMFDSYNSRMILQNALEDAIPRVRIMAIFFIEYQTNYYFVESLRKIAQKDKNIQVQQRAKSVLKKWNREH